MASEIAVTSRLTKQSAPAASLTSVGKFQWGFPEIFVVSQTAFPAILFLPGTQALRLPLRIAAFGISLLALALWMSRQRRDTTHPASPWLALVMASLTLMIFHPTTNTYLAGLGQTMLYLSVLAPLFWASPMVRSPERLTRLLLLLLLCNGINSLVGVLQVYAPEYFMPQEFSNIVLSSKFGLSSFTYINSAGKLAVRPPGLFDTPGAVCSAGMIAALLGCVFFLQLKKLWHRLGALILGGTGVAAVYLSQVRTAILIMGGMMAVYVLTVWFIQKRKAAAFVFLGLAGIIVTVLFTFTISRAGASSLKRFQSLTAGDPLTVYYNAHRGGQLENGFTELLPTYPLGAGLGRWGMMRVYFGDELNVDSPLIWSELQFSSWILDGGLPLMCFYCLALMVTAAYELKIARHATNPQLRLIAPVIVAANMGVLALIFGFTPFTTQFGMQYWFLAGALHGVAKTSGIVSYGRLRTRQ